MAHTLLSVEMFEDAGQTGIRYQNGHPDEPTKVETFDRLIAVLGEVRAGISPMIPPNPPAAHLPISAVFDPRWQISADPMGGGAVFRIRHPGFGWIAFSIPLHELVRFIGGADQIAQTMALNVPDRSRAS